MIKNTPAYDEIVLQAHSDDVDLLRYCLSDQVLLRIDTVLGETMSPIAYAHKTMQAHYQVIYDKFFSHKFDTKKIPQPLIRTMVFDALVNNGALMRTIAVRPPNVHYVEEFMSKASIYILATNTNMSIDLTYSGIAGYSFYAEKLIEYGHKGFFSKDLYALKVFIRSVGRIDHAHWIMRDSKWVKVLIDKKSKVRAFRNFIHFAIVSYMIPDDHLFEIMGMFRSDMFSLMDDFVSLRQSKTTTQKDVQNFVIRLMMYFDTMDPNGFFECLLKAPFSDFNNIHQARFGSMFKQPSSILS